MIVVWVGCCDGVLLFVRCSCNCCMNGNVVVGNVVGVSGFVLKGFCRFLND